MYYFKFRLFFLWKIANRLTAIVKMFGKWVERRKLNRCRLKRLLAVYSRWDRHRITKRNEQCCAESESPTSAGLSWPRTRLCAGPSDVCQPTVDTVPQWTQHPPPSVQLANLEQIACTLRQLNAVQCNEPVYGAYSETIFHHYLPKSQSKISNIKW